MAAPALGLSTNVRSLIGWFGDAFPNQAARMATSVWTRPRRFDPPAREAAVTASARPVRIAHGLGGLQGLSWGDPDAPTVLLVHGWEGRGAQLGSFVEPLVDAGFHVVTWDAPGHGHSEGSRASLFSFSDAIGSALRQFAPVHAVIGHSMGAAATLYAVRGVDVPRIALIAPASPREAPGRFLRFVGFRDAVRPRMEALLRKRWGMDITELDGASLAEAITHRTLVVHDRDDRFVPYADGAAIAANLVSGELVATDGLGHHRILRDPDVVDRVVDFVSERRSLRA